MDGKPLLARIVRLLNEHKIEAILIGNAAAALQGAPVTTIDFDFMFRRTPANVRKLVALTKALDAVMLYPHYPASGLIRIVRDDEGLQLDFMSTIDGVRSFEGLRSRASDVEFDGARLQVASLADLIRSKKAAGRPRDRAVMEILERALSEDEGRNKKTKAGSSKKRK
jgi:predicted nucleotidyltransferase